MIFQVCIPTPTVTGDGIDNDCDGKIDEELCTPENRNKGKREREKERERERDGDRENGAL